MSSNFDRVRVAKPHLLYICTGLVLLICSSVLLGWAFDIPSLKSILPHYITMKANTAVSFMLLALALLTMCPSDHRKVRVTIGMTFIAIVGTISIVTLLEYLLDVDLEIDQFLFPDPDGATGRFPPGRLAPITAVNFLLLCASLVARYVPERPRYKASQFLFGCAFIASFQGLAGYAVGLTYLFGSAFYTQMALHTTVCFILICFAVLRTQMDEGYVRAFTSSMPSSRMARHLLLAIVISPLLVRWIAAEGLAQGLYDDDFANLIQIVGSIVIMGVMLISSATALYATELQREEAKDRAELANRAKTNFLANISHELRTPLGAVLGFSELLATETKSMDERESITAAIKRNGDQLIQLIDDLLDVSNIDAGELKTERTKFTLAPFVEEICSLAKLKCAPKEIEFNAHFATALPEFVVSDPARLRQVLINVIGNAIKFTEPKGKVDLSIEFAPLITPILRFTVKDDGPGISRESARRLFEPFTQVDTSLTRRFGGAGLGLALSRKIAQALGGDLTLLDTHFQPGSTFTIDVNPGTLEDLKLIDLKQAPAPPKNAAESHPQPKMLEDVSILLVEDSKDNQVLITRFLKSAGADVEIANDGLEGVDKALHGRFDVVLMDLQMPNLDGYDAVKRLHGIGYKVPIIALTAHALREDRDRCLHAGFVEHLTKPINKLQLLHTVEAFVTPIHAHA